MGKMLYTDRHPGTRPRCSRSSSRRGRAVRRRRRVRAWARAGRGAAAGRSAPAPCGARTRAPAAPRCATAARPPPARAPTLGQQLQATRDYRAHTIPLRYSSSIFFASSIIKCLDLKTSFYIHCIRCNVLRHLPPRSSNISEQR